MEIEPLFQHAKHITNYFLKLRQWKVDKDVASEILGKCVQYYRVGTALSSIQTTTWSLIHLAAILDNAVCLKLLLDEDPKCFNMVYTNFNVTPLMCAAYSGNMECVNYLLSFDSAVLQYPKALLLWTVKGENLTCLEKLFELNVFGTKEIEPDLCELIEKDALGDNMSILKVILKYYPEAVFQTKHRNTTVYLAARKGLSNILKHFISLGVAVNRRNRFGLVPLHAALLSHCTDESAAKILEILLENGAEPNHEKIGWKSLDFRETTLYYAAKRGFSKCVFMLLKHGAIIDTRHTIQKLNSEISNFFQTHLNRLVTLTGVSNSHSKVLVAINLSFTGNLNNQRDLSETDFLNFLVRDGQEKYLLHPVIETYLEVKWIFVRKFYFVNLCLYVLTVLFFSLFVLDAYALQFGKSIEQQRTEIWTLTPYWWFSATTVIIRIITNIVRYSANHDRSMFQFDKLLHLALVVMQVVTLAASLRSSGEIPEWENTVAAFAAFFAWAFVLNYLRTQPTLGIYVEMLFKVLQNLAKFLLTYLCLLIGFLISFMVLYRGEEPFSSIPHALLRVMNMMVGEMGFETMFQQVENGSRPDTAPRIAPDNPTGVHVLFLVFIITVTIALINLLIGLAVSDIKGLRKRSKLHKTLKQISFISDLERFIYSRNTRHILPRRLVDYLDGCIQLPPSHHTIYVYPNDSNDKRLPKLLKLEALQIAIRNGMEDSGENSDKTTKLEAQLHTIQTQLEYLVKQKRGIQ